MLVFKVFRASYAQVWEKNLRSQKSLCQFYFEDLYEDLINADMGETM